jgi:hypothetical protein
MNTDMNLKSAPVSSDVNTVLEASAKSPGLCTRLAYDTANYVKRFGLGVAAGGIGSHISWGASYLAGKVGLIQEIGDLASSVKEHMANMAKHGFKIDSDAIINSTCKMQALVDQVNSNIPWEQEHTSVFAFKAAQVGMEGIGMPIVEEIVFRGLIQDVLLTRIPKYVIRKIAPGKEIALDTKIAKVARITLTAALFSATHLANSGFLADSHVSKQLVAAIVAGIGLGILKESNAGLLGAIGGHIANNIIAIAPALWGC